MSFFAPKTKMTQEAQKINSFQSSKCEFGTPLPIAYGTCRLSPNVINYQDFYAQQIVTTQKTGKKSSSTSIDYKYYVYCEMALCEGVINDIGKVSVGSNDYNSLAHLNGSGNEGRGLSLNVGDNPNPTDYMLTNHPNLAVGYKDMAYLYGTIYLGENSANMPSYNVEVFGKLRDTGDGVDANPCDVIVDLLKYIGLDKYIDETSFDNYRRYCKGANLLISTPTGYFDSQKKCQEVIADLLKLTNAYMFWSVDRFKIVPRDDRRQGNWSPNRQIVYSLTEDDFLPNGSGGCVSFSRKDSSEVYNRFGVTFINRENNYESETVFFEDTDDIIENGVKASSTIDASWVHTKERAIKIAEMQARINRTENIKYSFKLDMSYCRLESGDLVLLTDSAIGLESQPAMIDSVTEDAKGYLKVTAIKRADGIYTAPQYNVHKLDYNNVNFNINPYDTAPPLFLNPPKDLITSSSGLELWIALHGQHPNWGGCFVMVSDQDGNYTQLGMHPRSSIFGYILTDLTNDVDEVVVKATNPTEIELLSGSEWDADMDNTMLWIDGEYISYTRAELVDVNTYKLYGLLRGRFGTEVVDHLVNSNVASVDSDLYALEIPRHYADRTLYFKFPAFNYFGTNVQSIENLPYYTAQAVGDVKPIADVKVLDAELLSNGVRRFWWDYDFGKTKDTAGFEIRYIQGNYPNWEKGIQLHTGLLTEQPFETDALRQGVHTVMIKAVDTNGNTSKNVAYAILNLGDLLEDNVLYHARFNENNWANVLHDGLIDEDGNLVNKDLNAFWSNPNDVFWTNEQDEFWQGKYQELNLLWQGVALASGQMWFTYDIDGNFRLEYRVVGENAFWRYGKPFWGYGEDDVFWDESQTLWKPYTCKVEVKAGQVIQVRAYTGASSQATIIKSIEMLIDVIDREEHFENVEVPLEGLRLPIKTPNYYTTSVRIDAIQSNELVNRAVVIEKNPCVIKLVDVNNNPLSATVDVTWQGFIKEVI